MENCDEYLQQIKKAKETMAVLENDLYNIRMMLKDHPHDPASLRRLQQNTLDMTITLNEIEHSQSLLDSCRTESLRMAERYND